MEPADTHFFTEQLAPASAQYRIALEGGRPDYGTPFVAVYPDGRTEPLYTSERGDVMTRGELMAKYPQGTWGGFNGATNTFLSGDMGPIDPHGLIPQSQLNYGPHVYRFPRDESWLSLLKSNKK